VTRPIKGTRPRSTDPIADAANQAALCASSKDRAELAMIVDLMRNDLGRVCEFGSIRVVHRPDSPAAPYDLETHPTVHHLVATVTGSLAPDRDAIDLLRACFPGGSITGAPKVRAMEIIDELEPSERSVYTGAIGYFGLDGSMALNIAIRTIIAANGYNYIYAGGGIVTDSVPEDEYEETRAKVRGLCQALGIDETNRDRDNRPPVVPRPLRGPERAGGPREGWETGRLSSS
jgi:anthranilate/para-aminobenzoate synthase component I